MPDEKHQDIFEIPSGYYIFPFGVITRTGMLWNAVSFYEEDFNSKVSAFAANYRHAKEKGLLSERSIAIHDRVLAIAEEVKEDPKGVFAKVKAALGDEVDLERIHAARKLVGEFDQRLLDEFCKQGGVRLSQLFCPNYNNNWIGMLPKSQENLRFLTDLGRELADVRTEMERMAPQRFAEVRDEIDLLAPYGSLLVLEADVLLLSDSAQGHRDTVRSFQLQLDAELANIAARPIFYRLSNEEAAACVRYVGRYVPLGQAFRADCERIGVLFETGKKEEAIAQIRALREKAWLSEESFKIASVAKHKEEDDPNRWYFFLVYQYSDTIPPTMLGFGWKKVYAEDIAKLGLTTDEMDQVERWGYHFSNAALQVTETGRMPGYKASNLWCWGHWCGQAQILSKTRANLDFLRRKQKSLSLDIASAFERFVADRPVNSEVILDALQLKGGILTFEVRSPWLGQRDDTETPKLQEWLEFAKVHGDQGGSVSPNPLHHVDYPRESYRVWVRSVVKAMRDMRESDDN